MTFFLAVIALNIIIEQIATVAILCKIRLKNIVLLRCKVYLQYHGT